MINSLIKLNNPKEKTYMCAHVVTKTISYSYNGENKKIKFCLVCDQILSDITYIPDEEKNLITEYVKNKIGYNIILE